MLSLLFPHVCILSLIEKESKERERDKREEKRQASERDKKAKDKREREGERGRERGGEGERERGREGEGGGRREGETLFLPCVRMLSVCLSVLSPRYHLPPSFLLSLMLMLLPLRWGGYLDVFILFALLLLLHRLGDGL